MKIYKIISLLCLISVFNACKKELKDEFDPIIGKWKWYRTVKDQKDIFTGSVVYTEPYTWASSSTDQFEVEFRKKGLVLFYKNGKVERKCRIKDSNGTLGHTLGDVWHYTIDFKKNESIGLTYYATYDTLSLGKFPYYTSDNDDFNYRNFFIRE